MKTLKIILILAASLIISASTALAAPEAITVPEPASIILLGFGLVGLIISRNKFKK
ncbi:MAG: PEP-CTERM sorting domain-containing protein [Pseudomonadota bacterium]